MENRLLTPQEVAEKLQVSRLTVMSYLRSGALTGVKVGRLWRVDEQELRRFLAAPSCPDVPVVSDDPDSRWLDADLGAPLPPWDWGPGGRPEGKPVRYVPGVGLVVEGRKRRGK